MSRQSRATAQWVLFAACIFADVAAEGQILEMPPGIARPSEAIPRENRKGGPAWKAWSTRHGLVLRSGPHASSPAAQKQLGFMDAAYIAYFHPATASSGRMCLLVDVKAEDDPTIQEFFGWALEEELLFAPQALRVTGAGTEGLHRKGMAVVTQASLAKFKAQDRATVFLAPRAKQAPDPDHFAMDLQLHDFYFVYAETREFVLIGVNQAFDEKAAKDIVKGWLPRENHAEWGSRIGLEWEADSYQSPSLSIVASGSKRTEPGFVFGTVDKALAAVASSEHFETDPVGSVFAESIQNGVPRRLSDREMRMPQLKLDQREGNNLLWQVGWLGGTDLDPKKRAEAMDRIEIFESQLRKLDVVVVIDHTESMTPHFATVASAVQEVVKNLRENHLGKQGIYGRSMRLSISFYGDEDTAAKAVTRALADVDQQPANPRAPELQPAKLKTLARESNLSVNQMLAELPLHPSFAGGTIEEDVLFGVAKAIRMMPDDDGQKLLFVVGDMGDKSHGMEYERKRQAVARMLAERKVPIRLIVLQVETPLTKQGDGALIARLFRQQWDEVIADAAEIARKRGWPGDYGEFAQVKPISNTKELTTLIRSHYEQLQNEIHDLQAKLRDVVPSRLTELEKKRLEQAGINLDHLRVPLFRQGYVWELARPAARTNRLAEVQQVRRRVLLERKDLLDIKTVLGTLVEAIRANDSGGAGIGNIVRKAVGDIFGEDKDIGSVVQAFEIKAGIPFKSELLKLTYTELNSPDFRVRPKVRAEIEVALKRIDDILEGKTRKWIAKVNPATKSWEAIQETNSQAHQRGFSNLNDPSARTWYWIRDDELP